MRAIAMPLFLAWLLPGWAAIGDESKPGQAAAGNPSPARSRHGTASTATTSRPIPAPPPSSSPNSAGRTCSEPRRSQTADRI
jgi:hypothetical protein